MGTGGDSGEPIPMAIVVPRINDPLGLAEKSLLGLGDIAIPALFTAFVLRFDYQMQYKSWTRGYFFPVMVGYTLGLMAAFSVVVVTQEGQPALLFIVPAILIPTFALGHM